MPVTPANTPKEGSHVVLWPSIQELSWRREQQPCLQPPAGHPPPSWPKGATHTLCLSPNHHPSTLRPHTPRSPFDCSSHRSPFPSWFLPLPTEREATSAPHICSPHTGHTPPTSTQSQEACGHTCAHTQTCTEVYRGTQRPTEALKGLHTCARAHTHGSVQGPLSVPISLCSAYVLRFVCSVLMKPLSPHKQLLTDKMAQTLSQGLMENKQNAHPS